jgi:hypothetical protein
MGRSETKAKYGALFDEVEEILFRHDPMGINFGDNINEYATEVGTILPRLVKAKSEVDVQRIIQEEFVRWFGPPDAGLKCGPDFTKEAKEIWHAWLMYPELHT